MKPFNARAATPLVLLSLCLTPLAACGEKAEAPSGMAAAPSSKTVAETLKDQDGLGSLGKVVDNAGLGTVFEGAGPYTVFAPNDGAMSAAGAGGDLTDSALRAQGVALVRAHTVPGALTRADIGAAIDKAASHSVEMRTMAGSLLTFTRDGQTIVVKAADGASGRLVGSEALASNGVVQPVDGVLAKAGASG